MRKHFFRRKEEKMKISTKTIVTVGMFTAVLAVLSILQIPMPTSVPITLQTFAMALCGYVLGWQSGVAATLLYIVLGTVGVPIFAGMSAGPGVLFGYTGGFIFGFIFLTLLCGISVRRKNPAVKIILGVIGLLICHLLGAVQYAVLAHITIGASLVAVSLPYIVKDVISVVGAYLVAIAVRKALYAGNILQDAKAA